MWLLGSAVFSVVLLIVWKMMRKNIAKEIAHDINRHTNDTVERVEKRAKEIEKSTSDPDDFL